LWPSHVRGRDFQTITKVGRGSQEKHRGKQAKGTIAPVGLVKVAGPKSKTKKERLT